MIHANLSEPGHSPLMKNEDDLSAEVKVSIKSAKIREKKASDQEEVASLKESEHSIRSRSAQIMSQYRPDSKKPRQGSRKESRKQLRAINNYNGKEMDWFAFENRVREIVKDILEPYAIRSVDLQEGVKLLSDHHDKFKRKQDEMEFVMHKRNHRNSGIDELNKRLFDIENERKVQEAKNIQKIDGLKVQLDSTHDRMTQIEELSLTFKKQADDIKHEINGFFDQLTKFQDKFSKEQLKYKEDMNRNFLTLRNQYLKT